MTIRTWLTATSGNWDTAADWSGNTIPGNGANTDDAAISLSGTYTVTINDGEAPNSLMLNDVSATLSIDTSGVLAPGTSLDLEAGTLALAGTIQSATIVAAGASLVGSSGTLFGDTWSGPLVLDNGILNVVNGITLTGLSGTGSSELDLLGDATVLLKNSATLDGASDADPLSIVVNGIGILGGAGFSGATLTFGPDTIISISDGSELSLGYIEENSIVNDGTILGTGTGTTLDMSTTATNTATGTISVFGLDANTLDNIGVITAGNFGAVSQLTNSGTIFASNVGAGIDGFTNSGNVTFGNDSGTAEIVDFGGGFGGPSEFINSGVLTFGSNLTIGAGSSSPSMNTGTINLGSSDHFILDNFTGGGVFNIGNFAVLSVGKLSGSLTFDTTHGTLMLKSTGTLGASIFGYRSGTSHAADTIDVVGHTVDSFHYTANSNPATGGTLALIAGSTTVEVLTLAGANYVHAGFDFAPDGGTGTDVTTTQTACYRSGTHILTSSGEVPVEMLRAGDAMPAGSGAVQRVRWIGCTWAAIAPVMIHADAFAPGTPHRALWLSPDHAVLIGNALVPVRYLVNGSSITWNAEPGVVLYFHVELERHDVLFAEGLAAESYLDTGNRHSFEKWQSTRTPHKDLAEAGIYAASERT